MLFAARAATAGRCRCDVDRGLTAPALAGRPLLPRVGGSGRRDAPRCDAARRAAPDGRRRTTTTGYALESRLATAGLARPGQPPRSPSAERDYPPDGWSTSGGATGAVVCARRVPRTVDGAYRAAEAHLGPDGRPTRKWGSALRSTQSAPDRTTGRARPRCSRASPGTAHDAPHAGWTRQMDHTTMDTPGSARRRTHPRTRRHHPQGIDAEDLAPPKPFALAATRGPGAAAGRDHRRRPDGAAPIKTVIVAARGRLMPRPAPTAARRRHAGRRARRPRPAWITAATWRGLRAVVTRLRADALAAVDRDGPTAAGGAGVARSTLDRWRAGWLRASQDAPDDAGE